MEGTKFRGELRWEKRVQLSLFRNRSVILLFFHVLILFWKPKIILIISADNAALEKKLLN